MIKKFIKSFTYGSLLVIGLIGGDCWGMVKDGSIRAKDVAASYPSMKKVVSISEVKLDEKRWIDDYAAWVSDLRLVECSLKSDSLTDRNSLANLWNREMNRFLHLHVGSWTCQNRKRAILRLKKLLEDCNVHYVTECAIQGQIESLEILKDVDLSENASDLELSLE